MSAQVICKTLQRSINENRVCFLFFLKFYDLKIHKRSFEFFFISRYFNLGCGFAHFGMVKLNFHTWVFLIRFWKTTVPCRRKRCLRKRKVKILFQTVKRNLKMWKTNRGTNAVFIEESAMEANLWKSLGHLDISFWCLWSVIIALFSLLSFLVCMKLTDWLYL